MRRDERYPEPFLQRITPTALMSVRERVARSSELQAQATKVQALLVRSEELLLRAVGDKDTRGFVKAAPGAFADPDFAHVSFWLNFPASDDMRAVAELWRAISGQLPPTQLTPQTYAALLQTLKTVFFVEPDGSIFGDGQYQMLDPAGIPMFGEYLWHYFFEDFASFNTAPPVIQLKGATEDQVTIAVVGDWGTGPYSPHEPAQSKYVEWYADTPNPDPTTAPRVFNGFAHLTLSASGRVSEVFYDQTGQAVYRPASYRLGDKR